MGPRGNGAERWRFWEGKWRLNQFGVAMRHLGFERDEDAGLREKRPTGGNGGISAGFGPKLGSTPAIHGGKGKIFLKKEKFAQLLIKPVLAVQVLRKSQA